MGHVGQPMMMVFDCRYRNLVGTDQNSNQSKDGEVDGKLKDAHYLYLLKGCQVLPGSTAVTPGVG